MNENICKEDLSACFFFYEKNEEFDRFRLNSSPSGICDPECLIKAQIFEWNNANKIKPMKQKINKKFTN